MGSNVKVKAKFIRTSFVPKLYRQWPLNRRDIYVQMRIAKIQRLTHNFGSQTVWDAEIGTASFGNEDSLIAPIQTIELFYNN